MKLFKFMSLVLVGSLVLAGCGNEATEELDQNDTEKAVAKTDGTESDSKKESDKEEDIWTYYEDANWQGSFQDLHYNIQKVVVSDKAPKINDDGEEVEGSAVGFKMQVENKSADKIYTSYPDQATLVTSTGEQVEADLFLSDDLGGEIHEGVIKEGNVIFYLERGEAEKIEWVKFTWNNSYEDPNGNYENDVYKDMEVKLDLKK